MFFLSSHNNYRKKQAILTVNENAGQIGDQLLGPTAPRDRMPIEPLSRQTHCRNGSIVHIVNSGIRVNE
ncbi:hypothetical protein Y032_0022g545 [Ancylostoma ceylanicum]|uniref:Uncharacterized protein n=1 Tax=Ancylostoma ceylanicum TaxID=53326 RepID=A0A016UZQ1_9BILA|nr:hypothetical protein Y032_0022g545 [Ancylostoma ceylanicum]